MYLVSHTTEPANLHILVEHAVRHSSSTYVSSFPSGVASCIFMSEGLMTAVLMLSS